MTWADRLRWAAVTAGGAGHLRPAPGTWGSAVAVAAWGLAWLAAFAAGGLSPWAQSAWLATLSGLAFAVGVALGPWAIDHFARQRVARSFGKDAASAAKDPSAVVLDEVCGQWAALALVPAASPTQFALNAALAFVLFRVCDILKPPPARQLERLPAGWGIMADDLAAGLMAGVLAALALRGADAAGLWSLPP